MTTGVEEAAAKIGWTVRVLDGAGSVQGRTAAVGQALALQPNGIIINGFDAVEQQAALEGVTAAKIPMVSWHSGPKIGCDAPGGIFANVSTDAMTVSEEAAKWAVADAGGKPGVVIFTDSHLSDRHRQGRPHQGNGREDGRHGSGICRYADRRHVDPDGAADDQPAAEIRRQLDPCAGDQRHLFRLHGPGAGRRGRGA